MIEHGEVRKFGVGHGGKKYAARRHDATSHGHSHLTGRLTKFLSCFVGQVAQLVEQRTENPRVGGSIPSLATKNSQKSRSSYPPQSYIFAWSHIRSPITLILPSFPITSFQPVVKKNKACSQRLR